MSHRPFYVRLCRPESVSIQEMSVMSPVLGPLALQSSALATRPPWIDPILRFFSSAVFCRFNPALSATVIMYSMLITSSMSSFQVFSYLFRMSSYEFLLWLCLFRRSVSSQLPAGCTNYLEKVVSSICSCLSWTYWWCDSIERRNSSKHIIQAFYSVCARVQISRFKRIGSSGRAYRTYCE